jgi:hypothetical protein
MYYPTKIKKLSNNQVSRLISGSGVRINKGQGDVIYLTEQQIKKLNRGVKLGKGITVNFDPYQQQQHRQLKNGGALGSMLKNVGRATKKTLGRTFDKDLRQDTIQGLKTVGRHAIEQGVPSLLSVGSMALGDPTGMSGAMLGNVVSEYGSKAYQKKVEGKGLFKALHKAGIKNPKKKLMSGLKNVGRVSAMVGSKVVGDAIGEYTGDPEFGDKFGRLSNNFSQNAINGNLKESLIESGQLVKKQAQNFAVEAVDDYIDKNLTGNLKRVAQDSLAGKYPQASDFIYDVSDIYGTNKTGGKIALKKKVGRPRKNKKGGALYPAGY